MEFKTEASRAQYSLLLLNDYCLMDIFEYLEIQDSINLAASCNRLRLVADRVFKKYSSFELNSTMANAGVDHIDYILSYIGEHVSSLIVKCTLNLDLRTLLDKIINNCKNFKNLKVCNWQRSEMTGCENAPFVNNFDKVEVLTLIKCYDDFATSLLGNFHKVKWINIKSCPIEPTELKKFFQNNPSIESFLWHFGHFDCQMLDLIPNVERLSLDLYHPSNISELNSLLRLNRLTKLQLDCQDENINNFIKELARKGIMKEMQLYSIVVDDSFFKILTSFDKLQLLVVSSSTNTNLTSPILWPTKLKQLLLGCFYLTHIDLIAMVQQLRSLQNIDLWDCGIPYDDSTNFNVDKLQQQIQNAIGYYDGRQLNVVLPNSIYRYTAREDRSKKYLVDSGKLRILHNSSKRDPLEIDKSWL